VARSQSLNAFVAARSLLKTKGLPFKYKGPPMRLPLMTYVIPTPFAAMMAYSGDFQRVSGIMVAPLLAMPFDAMREQYAVAVRVGLMKSSLLASSRFGRLVSNLERYMLGPLARHV